MKLAATKFGPPLARFVKGRGDLKVPPASHWQNLPARCRQHPGWFGAIRVLSCLKLARPLTGFTLLITLCLAARAAPGFELRDGDRVLFIGDTFFEREVDYGHIETRLTAAFPDRNVT